MVRIERYTKQLNRNFNSIFFKRFLSSASQVKNINKHTIMGDDKFSLPPRFGSFGTSVW